MRIIVTGFIAQHPTLGGMTWHYLHYLIGLAQLGHDVYYIEDSGEWPYTRDGGPSANEWIAHDCTSNVTYLAAVMDRFGLGDRWAYHFPIKSRWFGMANVKRREIVRTADLLINVSGSLRRPSDYRAVGRLAYVDSDPVFTQVKLALSKGHLKFRKRVNAHDVHFTFGERLSDADVAPQHHSWRATRQPIALSEWRSAIEHRGVYTTVMNWTSYRPLRYARRMFCQKDVEFRRFLNLPHRVAPAVLEVAMSDIEHAKWQTPGTDVAMSGVLPNEERPADALARFGWKVANAMTSCGNLDAYRSFVQSSKGEWSIAKNGYVVGQPGWFSDRSACYLAAGRPVVVQDTGFGKVLPVGQGVLSFRTPDEAVAGVLEVESGYRRHAKAALEIAHEFFDSGRVLTRLLEDTFSTTGKVPTVDATRPPAIT